MRIKYLFINSYYKKFGHATEMGERPNILAMMCPENPDGQVSLWLQKCLRDGTMKLSMYFQPTQINSHPAMQTSMRL